MNNLSPLIECIRNAGEAVAKHGFRPVFREEHSVGVLTASMLDALPYPSTYYQIAEGPEDAYDARRRSKLFCDVSPCINEQSCAVDVTVCLLPDSTYNTEELLSISTRQLQDSHHAVVWAVRSGQAWRTALNPDFAFEFGGNNELTCLLWLKNWSN